MFPSTARRRVPVSNEGVVLVPMLTSYEARGTTGERERPRGPLLRASSARRDGASPLTRAPPDG
ncbi:hypothetical protein GCM10010378_46520 [Streptomyces viridochromogenes]